MSRRRSPGAGPLADVPMSGHRCRLAIVGSTSLAGNPQAVFEVMRAITEHDPIEVISGGAVGIDTMAEREAEERGIPTRIFRPERRQWAGPGGFKERNARIATACDHLVRIYDPDSGTYGSGWTADLAEKQGRRVTRIAVQAAESR